MAGNVSSVSDSRGWIAGASLAVRRAGYKRLPCRFRKRRRIPFPQSAYGRRVLRFAWSRMTVVQTGAIAAGVRVANTRSRSFRRRPVGRSMPRSASRRSTGQQCAAQGKGFAEVLSAALFSRIGDRRGGCWRPPAPQRWPRRRRPPVGRLSSSAPYAAGTGCDIAGEVHETRRACCASCGQHPCTQIMYIWSTGLLRALGLRAREYKAVRPTPRLAAGEAARQ